MLKFIGQNDKNNEKKIEEELGLKTNLLEFFSSSDPKDIIEKINSTLSEIKSNTKREESFYTKLLYYFSFVINSKSFKLSDEKTKKTIKNIIEIGKEKNYIQIYQDLFNLFGESQNECKKLILNEILSSNVSFSEEECLSLYTLFINFLNLSFDLDIVGCLSELVSKNKNYYLLRKNENIEKLRITIRNKIDQKTLIIKDNINICKFFFFLTLSSPDLIEKIYENFELNDELEEEKELLYALNNRKDEYILFNKDLIKYFDETYGDKSCELILIGAKETCIHEVLIKFDKDKQKIVSFKEFIEEIIDENDFKDEEIRDKFEEIEEVLISGKEHKLYTVVVDYLKKEIKILYLRKVQYEKGQKTILLEKVKNMKNRLKKILNNINKI